MIDRLLEFSIRNRALVIFGVLLVGALGLRAAQAPIDAVPDVTNVQVQVLTNAPALGPLEVERFVTFPVEAVMSGLPRLERGPQRLEVRPVAVTVVFEEGTDIYFARQLVAVRLSEAREAIPEGYGTPEMGPISTGLGEIYQFEVRGEPDASPTVSPTREDCYTPMELRTVLDWYIAYQLRSVPGVVEVNTFGGEVKTYEVQLDPARLTAYDLSLGEVFEALERNNGNAGGGYIAARRRAVPDPRGGPGPEPRGHPRASSSPRARRHAGHHRRPRPTVAFAPMVRQGAVTATAAARRSSASS